MLAPINRSAIVHSVPLDVFDLHGSVLRVNGHPLCALGSLPTQAQASTLHALSLPADLPASAGPALEALASAGVILVGSSIPGCSAEALPFLPAAAFEQEVASVRSRRDMWAPAVADVPVSVVLSTNRTDRVATVLQALADQSHANLEVILIAHGADPSLITVPEGLAVTVLHAGSEVLFGSALTLGASAASGDVVLKVDDDDFYGPHHVLDVLVARAYSGAPVTGKALQYVYLEPIDVSSRTGSRSASATSEQFGDWVAGGTLAIDRSFGDSVGWFDALPRHVDRNILDKALAAQAPIYRTHGLGYLYVRHDDGHTWVTDFSRYLAGSIEQRPGVWAHGEFFSAGVLTS